MISKGLTDTFARKYPKALKAIELFLDVPPGFDIRFYDCSNETCRNIRSYAEALKKDFVHFCIGTWICGFL